MNRKACFAAAAALCLTVSLGAQNLNPHVVVTNDYEGKVMDVNKKDVPMAIPDSLQNFDLRFDYSVFENPYRGSYEFSPYLLTVKPDATPDTGKKFYLRAGAGYTMHPEAQLVFSPEIKGGASFSVYDTFRGFFGPYSKQAYGQYGSGFSWRPADGTYGGRDMENRLGFNLRYDSDMAEIYLDASYHMLGTKDNTFDHMSNAADINARFKSRPFNGKNIAYDLNIGLRFGADNGSMLTTGTNYKDYSVGDFELKPDLLLSTRLTDKSSVKMNVGVDMASYSGDLSAYVANLYANPKYVFTIDKATVSLGARIQALLKDDKGLDRMFGQKSRIYYPDVNASYAFIPGGLTAYVFANGGNEINAYSSLMARDHFLNAYYALTETDSAVLDASVTKINAGIGFKGCIASHLQYDIKGGYAMVENLLMDALRPDPVNHTSRHFFTYGDLNKAYVEAALNWKSENFDAKIRGNFMKVKLVTENLDAIGAPKFSGAASFTYNWEHRFFIGLNAEYVGERPGAVLDPAKVGGGLQPVTIPSWFDLGATFEYRFSSLMSLWAAGGNLLNQTVQRSLLHAENGPNFTVGICLNF